jgi:predicted O-methyltransferase YrrM
MAYEFTSSWHLQHIKSWENWLAEFVNQPIQALEIGSYEGRSAIWMCEHILRTAGSHLICVDPFGYDYQLSTVKQPNPKVMPTTLSVVEQRFLKNTLKLREAGLLQHLKANSQQVLPQMTGTKSFDLIYIDGSHQASCVLQDSVICWGLLKNRGLMIWDDYLWKHDNRQNNHELGRPKLAIDSFLSCFKEQYEVIDKGQQVCIRKVTYGEMLTV